MRVAVLTDIHGNLPALEAVIADMAQFDVDHVIIAGDSVNMGPFSTEVIERIASERWAVIRGNHEMYMLEYGRPSEPPHRRNWPIPKWINAIMPDDLRNYVATLPDTLEIYYPEQPLIRLLHASPGDHFLGIYSDTPDNELTRRLESIKSQIVITGHTHQELDRRVGQWRVLNPGSVGLPLDGDQAARYMLLESHDGEWQPVFRKVDYDLTPLFERFDELDYVGLHGATGRLVIEELKTARTMLWGFVKWRSEYYPDEKETLEMAEEYLEHPTYRWEYMHPTYRVNLDLPENQMNGGHD